METKLTVDAFTTLPTDLRVRYLLGEHTRFLDAPEGLLLGGAELDGKTVNFAATRREIRTGTLGVAECDALAEHARRAQQECDAFVFLVDSAGARLDEGLPIQGGLRRAMRALVDVDLAGLPTAAVLGRNAFGGASLLAYALSAQFYSVDTRMAMTGPRVLQQAGAVSEDAVMAVINGAARCRQAGLAVCEPGSQAAALRGWLQDPEAHARAGKAELRKRVELAGLNRLQDEPVFIGASTLVCQSHLIPGAADLLYFADAIESLQGDATIEVRWSGHSTDLKDEAVVQTELLANLCRKLRMRARRGHATHLRVHGEISGGLFIALAAGASDVTLGLGGKVLTLPPNALQNILKTDADMTTDDGDPLSAGAVDHIAK